MIQGNRVIGCNDAGSWIFGNKHETAKNKIFTAAKTFLDVVTRKMKHLQNICKNVLEPLEVDKCFTGILHVTMV